MEGRKFAMLRKKIGLTQRALALKLDCTVGAISSWESGAGKIKKVYELALLKVVADAKRGKKSGST